MLKSSLPVSGGEGVFKGGGERELWLQLGVEIKQLTNGYILFDYSFLIEHPLISTARQHYAVNSTLPTVTLDDSFLI